MVRVAVFLALVALIAMLLPRWGVRPPAPCPPSGELPVVLLRHWWIAWRHGAEVVIRAPGRIDVTWPARLPAEQSGTR